MSESENLKNKSYMDLESDAFYSMINRGSYLPDELKTVHFGLSVKVKYFVIAFIVLVNGILAMVAIGKALYFFFGTILFISLILIYIVFYHLESTNYKATKEGLYLNKKFYKWNEINEPKIVSGQNTHNKTRKYLVFHHRGDLKEYRLDTLTRSLKEIGNVLHTFRASADKNE